MYNEYINRCWGGGYRPPGFPPPCKSDTTDDDDRKTVSYPNDKTRFGSLTSPIVVKSTRTVSLAKFDDAFTRLFAGFLNANVSPNTRARVANYGLMDQIAVLHWVQQNIALFGGDPENVSLMGHGPGAACINFLMISPTVVPGTSPPTFPRFPPLFVGFTQTVAAPDMFLSVGGEGRDNNFYPMNNVNYIIYKHCYRSS